MKTARTTIALVVLTLSLLVALAGCGGGGESTGTTTRAKPTSPAVVAKADAICHQIAVELRAIGHRAARATVSNGLELTTEHLIRPTIPVLARAGRRLEALKAAAGNPSYDLFVNLFDPALVLAEKRLAAGQRHDPATAEGLEEQLTNLGETQRAAALDAGLHDCAVDFQHILASSVNG